MTCDSSGVWCVTATAVDHTHGHALHPSGEYVLQVRVMHAAWMVGCTTTCVAPVYLSTSLVSKLTQTSTGRGMQQSETECRDHLKREQKLCSNLLIKKKRMQRSFAISSLLHCMHVCVGGWWERTAFWLATLWRHRVRRSCSSTNGKLHACESKCERAVGTSTAWPV
jgi:hypothetical protein